MRCKYTPHSKKNRVTIVPQSIAEVDYFLCCSQSVINKLHLYREKIIPSPFGNFRIGIIGESHIIQLENKYQAITEILASINDSKVRKILNKTAVAKYQLINLLKNNIKFRYLSDMVSYTFQLAIRRYTLGRYKLVYQQFIKNHRNKLVYFWNNSIDNPALLKPFSSIEFDYTQTSVEFITCHMYPNELSAVLTKTIFKNREMKY